MRIKKNWLLSLIYSLVVSNVVHVIIYLLVQQMGYSQMKFWHGLIVVSVVSLLFWLFRVVEWD